MGDCRNGSMGNVIIEMWGLKHAPLQLICTLGGKEDGSLAEQIMHNLLGRQVDSSYMVRMYCIRGLGNMAAIGGAQVSQFSTTILR